MNEIEQAIKAIENIAEYWTCRPSERQAAQLALVALREKADFVRCKYCEYWQDNNGGYPHEECRWGHDETPDADDFCSCGKRLEVEP